MGIRVKTKTLIGKFKYWLKSKENKKIDKKLEELGSIRLAIELINNKIDGELKNIYPEIKKINDMDELASMMKNELESFHKARETFSKLDGLKEKVKIEYDRYIKDLTEEHKRHIRILHHDISEYKKNDNAVVRLSSLETRITLMELNQKKFFKDSPLIDINSLEKTAGS